LNSTGIEKKRLFNRFTKEKLVAAITHIVFYAGWITAASRFGHLEKVIDQNKWQRVAYV
jgi:alkylhydroperoxidase/carboxymuconolactone decarboxylase family protein YurZ